MSEKLIRFSGVAFTDRDLENGDELHVQVVNSAGETVADAFGAVSAVTFRPRKDSPETIERIHSVKVA